MVTIIRNILCLCLIFNLSCSDRTRYAFKNEKQKVKNVILLIGDGMGLSQVSTAFYYKGDMPNFQRFKSIGLIKTSSSSDLITDSAAGATAFSTGVKTYNGSVGMNRDTINQQNIIEYISELGMKSGVIATSSITHATPASFYAHVKSRELHEDIATWLPKSNIDYFAAGGLKYFNKRTDNQDYIKELEIAGFSVKTEFLGLNDPLKSEKRYGFLLAENGMPTMQEGRGNFLKQATDQALEYLSKKTKGFFLIIEGSQIDWGGHNNDSQYIINEVIDFDSAIGSALDFAESKGNTLVIVTADHETGGFTLASDSKKDTQGSFINDYNNIRPSFSTNGHSATLIPVFAFGPGSEKFNGIYENNKIFEKISDLL